ncbi:hypothetical protein ABPG75_004672 [Micractinium tetrahymenae]
MVPCEPNSYNGMLGLSGECTTCPGSGAGTHTNYAAAQQCDVERVDLLCASDTTASWAYDKASQQCQKCQAGTWRDYGDDSTTACKPCPAGSFSAEGDATCTLCPAGQYSPSEGLANQSSITGIPCIKCAEGSMPLKEGNEDPATGGAGLDALATTGSTYCDAWS